MKNRKQVIYKLGKENHQDTLKVLIQIQEKMEDQRSTFFVNLLQLEILKLQLINISKYIGIKI